MKHNDDGIQIVVNVNVNINGKNITSGSSNSQASEEVQAAIAMALYQYMNEEDKYTYITSQGNSKMKNNQTVSAWANKYFTLRKMPGQW